MGDFHTAISNLGKKSMCSLCTESTERPSENLLVLLPGWWVRTDHQKVSKVFRLCLDEMFGFKKDDNSGKPRFTVAVSINNFYKQMKVVISLNLTCLFV